MAEVLDDRVDIHAFVDETLQLLNLERQAEIDQFKGLQDVRNSQELEKLGIGICKLHLISSRSGLYGRTLLTFKSRNRKELPAHAITIGDIIGVNLSADRKQCVVTGVVNWIGDAQITVAVDQSQEQLDTDYQSMYDIIKLANDVTYNRLKRAMKALDRYREGIALPLIDVIFGNAPLRESQFQMLNMRSMRDSEGFKTKLSSDGILDEVTDNFNQFNWFNKLLDESQENAIKFAALQSQLAMIHGPPGTGKTTVVVELLMQCVIRWRMKILACAPSNIAVDNMIEKLSRANKTCLKGKKINFVRLGHPARLFNHLQCYSLDALLSSSDSADIIRDVRRDIDGALSSIHKGKGDRKKLRSEIKLLRRELKERENKATREILTKADIIFATLTGATDDGPMKYLPNNHFDMVVIDEAAQALEASCWIALLHSSKCVLAGDHFQLPPTIISEEAAKKGLAITLMERCTRKFSEECLRMLTVQYRMNEKIMNWSSERFYKNKLKASSSVKEHLLRDLPNVEDDENTRIPLLFVDTAGCDFHEIENTEQDTPSRGNAYEVDLVVIHVEKLLNAGIQPCDIGVITPYNLQVELLHSKLNKMAFNVEVKSVDGFQGREKEAIIISLVRSNTKGEVGFLSEYRRMNVAVTRARRHLAIIADSETVGRDEHIKSFVRFLNDVAEVRSAFQYLDDMHERTPPTAQKLQSIKLLHDVKMQSSEDCIQHKKHSTKEINTDNTTIERLVVQERVKAIGLDTKSGVDALSVEKIREKIERFAEQDQDLDLSFPSSLSSYKRRKVHEFAETLGLEHCSTGIGKERKITIRKKKSDDCSQATANVPVEIIASEESNWNIEMAVVKDDKETSSTDTYDTFKCATCLKLVSISNKALHKLRCVAASGTTRPSKNNKQPTNERVKTKPVIQKINDDDNFDALINAAVAADNECALGKCKRSVATLGLCCEHCHRRFCFTHQLPEVHGCGKEARIAARKEFKSAPKSNASSSLKNTIKQDYLHKKLNEKINDKSESRRGKKSKKK